MATQKRQMGPIHWKQTRIYLFIISLEIELFLFVLRVFWIAHLFVRPTAALAGLSVLSCKECHSQPGGLYSCQ
uniref:Transmembrane protein 216 n=1 Tax=Bursaphelenchus xylophilus TaxID=6326 RepID=A0A1I7RVM3_BURXY